MEQSKALQRLIETADLIKLVEEVSAPGAGALSESARSGIRILLRNAREAVLTSHDALASQIIQRAQVQLEAGAPAPQRTNGQNARTDRAPQQEPASSGFVPARGTEDLSRRDLRASLEKIIES